MNTPPSFRIKKPCKNCPFTANKQESINLAKGRREQIISDLMTGKELSFVCHKTIYEDESKNGRAVCAGAVAVCKQRGKVPAIVEIAERMGVIDSHWYDKAVELSCDNFELGV